MVESICLNKLSMVGQSFWSWPGWGDGREMWDVAFLRFRVRKKTQSRSQTLLVSHTFFSPLVSLLLFSFRAGQKNS